MFAFNVQPARAQSGGTIYINRDGSISPSTANITNSGNVTYTFTGNNYLPIIVNRSNIIINGMGHTLQVPFLWSGGTGFSLTGMSNVTIKNITITNSAYGIYLYSSSGNVLCNNIVANGAYGIWLDSSSDNNTLSGNNVTTNSNDGIDVCYSSSGNVLSGNNVTANGGSGILLNSSSGNVLSRNNIITNGVIGVALWYSSDNNTLSGNNVTTNIYYGVDLWVSSDDNTLSGNNIANSYYGVALGYSSDNNTLSGNNIANDDDGIALTYCDNNTLSDNNVSANSYCGVYLYSSSNNRFYHNNFISNTHQVYDFSLNNSAIPPSINTWDDGYPSGGNYWSSYRTTYPNAVEVDSSAVWNASYIIDANNTDRYPLMGPFHTFDVGTWNGTAYSVDMVSNSTITNVSFNATLKTLSFNVAGPSSTGGFCRIAIPRALMWCDNETQWAVVMKGSFGSLSITVYPHLNILTDANYTYIHFAYAYNTPKVLITSTNAIPEFQPYMLLLLLMMITLLTAIVSKRKRNAKK